MSDAALGPCFDARGNIYIAEYVRPRGWSYPEEFTRLFGPLKERIAPGSPRYETANMYGSIVKFSPRGGMVHVPVKGGLAGGPDPFTGTPRLDGMKKMECAYFYTGLLRPVTVTGALWIHPGISHVGIFRCTCENITFDVDEFGRVWFPDINLFQVRVIDTNGNRITEFGSYGNAENRGPDSPVVDGKTGLLRPPRPGEKSPFAAPEIAFAWVVGVAVTDGYVYAGDSINRRMLRLKIAWKAEESRPVP